MTDCSDFLGRGWALFEKDPLRSAWVDAIRDVAFKAPQDKENAHWFRHQNTWFVGVNALPNDAFGSVEDGPALNCRALSVAREIYGTLPLDRAQVSVAYPGYPRQDPNESGAAHRFRRDRDAAHVDGLKPVGRERRRKLDEFHAFVLGLPLTDSPDAPLVVWDKSHKILGAAFRQALDGVPPQDWATVDVTEVYLNARKRVFDTCQRIELAATAGQATLLHRFTLHGVAPWKNPASGYRHRAVAYFRPSFAPGSADYLESP